jgi:peptidoglycan/xylan/chitin deacetylase (PgdA/CDA1 family)
MPSAPAILTLSLDFELYWGTRDHRALSAYGSRIVGGRSAVPRMLELFEEFGVHATWAIVGFTLFENAADLAKEVPSVLPAYADARLSPYPDIPRIGRDERAPEYFFAPELVSRIRATPFQEIGSHTFSHYYCLEEGQTPEAFAADLDAMRAMARTKLERDIVSLVFPRNQSNDDYLALCRRAGIRAFRGNPRSWVYEPKKGADESLVRRGLRLADSYVNLTGHHGHDLAKLRGADIVDIPASRFLRPYSRRLRALEPLRLRRIERDLTHAAKNGLLYHLWWHPENFGGDTEENLRFLRKILEHFRTLQGRYEMRSHSMGEVAELLQGAA